MAKRHFLRDVLGVTKDSNSVEDVMLQMDEEKCGQIAYMSYKIENEVMDEIVAKRGGNIDKEEFGRVMEEVEKESLERLLVYCDSLNFEYKYPQENAMALLEGNVTAWLPVAVEEWLKLDAEYSNDELEYIARTHKHPALSNLESASNTADISEYIKRQIKKYDNYLTYLVLEKEGEDYDFEAVDAEFVPICLNCGHLRLTQYTSCPNCGTDFYPSEETALSCSKCGTALEEGSKFCTKCGTPVEEVNFCSSCGNKIDRGSKFCSKCGKEL